MWDERNISLNALMDEVWSRWAADFGGCWRWRNAGGTCPVLIVGHGPLTAGKHHDYLNQDELRLHLNTWCRQQTSIKCCWKPWPDNQSVVLLRLSLNLLWQKIDERCGFIKIIPLKHTVVFGTCRGALQGQTVRNSNICHSDIIWAALWVALNSAFQTGLKDVDSAFKTSFSKWLNNTIKKE